VTVAVLAEKPSVARDLARVLGCTRRAQGRLSGNGYVVTWALGHLVALPEPAAIDPRYKRWRRSDLPILPRRWPLSVIRKTRKQFDVVRRVLTDSAVTEVICATDAGREGELIFRTIYEVAGCTKPVRRLWISSLTPAAIRQGMASLRPGPELEGLAAAARGRSRADWLVGMNLSRHYSLLHNERLSVGRVQTPTLAMLAQREVEIRDFVPEPYLQVRATFGPMAEAPESPPRAEPAQPAEPGPYDALWVRQWPLSGKGEQTLAKATRLPADGDEVKAIVRRVRRGQAAVQRVDARRKREPPPLLYDLTELQRHANRLWGFSARKTLDLAQRLYERHKVLSYPRTDSRHLTQAVAATLPAIVSTVAGPYRELLGPGTGERALGRRYVDDSKVGDHHAILPTTTKPRKLSADERRIYDLVCRRLLMAWQPDHEYSTVTVITAVRSSTTDSQAETVDRFFARGRAVEREGWRRLQLGSAGKGAAGKDKGGRRGAAKAPAEAAGPSKGGRGAGSGATDKLPAGLVEGLPRAVQRVRRERKTTKPPKRYTEGTLLTAMERAGRSLDDKELSAAMKDCGLGTPATRAQIIETLLRREYIRRKGRSLEVTELGLHLIDVVHPEVRSPAMTGEWEAGLQRIQRGQARLEPFLHRIEAYVARVVGGEGASPGAGPHPGSSPVASRPAQAVAGEPGRAGAVSGPPDAVSGPPADPSPARPRRSAHGAPPARVQPPGGSSMQARLSFERSHLPPVVGPGRGGPGLGSRSERHPPPTLPQPRAPVEQSPPAGPPGPPGTSGWRPTPPARQLRLPGQAARPATVGPQPPAEPPLALGADGAGDEVLWTLQQRFGMQAFRPHQERICRAIVQGRSALVVMPTGAGKSLCYQLPGVVRGGPTLVISPLIALMEDQVQAQRAPGLRAERIHSGRQRLESRQVCRDYAARGLDFLFVAPERLRVPRFTEFLLRYPPTLVAVDEAHCISHWGHDFRPDYRMLAERLKGLAGVPVAALTATATPRVQDDILEQLGLDQAERFICGFRRANLAIEAVRLTPRGRAAAIEAALAESDRRPAIVYSSTRKETERLAKELGQRFDAEAYHAGLPAARRDAVQQAFIGGRTEVVVATIAFGMGIDKANVRSVIHAALPSSLEGYYQEIGRAGRDGLPSRALLLHSYGDRRTHLWFHERDYPEPETLHRLLAALGDGAPTREELQRDLGVDGDALERALDKLWVHGGVDVDADDRVRATGADWLPSYLERKGHHAEQIESMARFAEGGGCRMLALIRHFGDQDDPGTPCGLCDHCAPERCSTRAFAPPSGAEQVQLARLLEAVSASTFGVGVGRLGREALGSGAGRDEVQRLVMGLERAGLVHLEDDSFAKDGQTIRYKRVVLGEVDDWEAGLERVRLEKAAAASPARKRRSTRSTSGAKTRRTRKGRRGKKSSSRGASASAFVSGPEGQVAPDPAVAEALKAWRRAEAARRGIPAFRILTDRCLLAVAAARPQDGDELLSVKGMGPTLARRYGKAILQRTRW